MAPERDVARLAAGAAGEIEAGALAIAIDDTRRLVDLLQPDEQPHHLLEGLILDVVHRRDGGERDERARKMATTDGAIYALVTDRGVRFVVSHGASATSYDLEVDDLSSVSMRQLGGDMRIRLALDGTAYDFYPTDGAASCEAAVAFLTARIEARTRGDERDPLERLDRLADLPDRGALTQTEFEAKKRDLLDEI